MSINVSINHGRYGNQLFMYFFTRLLSEELNFKIINGTNTYDINYNFDQTGRLVYNEPIQEVNEENLNYFDDYLNIINDKSPRRINVSGFLQVKDIYLKNKNTIKKFYSLNKFNVSQNAVAMHIRLGDLMMPNHLDHMLPFEYYKKALEFFPSFDRINICSDTPNHPYVEYFVKNYNANVFWGNEKQTISFLASHNNLILSQGSFSFWSAFFCEGETIVNAIPKTGWNTHPVKNLLVFDNQYKFIKI